MFIGRSPDNAKYKISYGKWNSSPISRSTDRSLSNLRHISRCSFRLLPRFADAVEMFVAANENPPLRDRRRRKNHLAERVCSDHFVRRPGFDHERIAVFARQKKLSVVGH